MIGFGQSQQVNALGLFQQGMAARRQFDARGAMSKLAANPNDPDAMRVLRQADPETAYKYEERARAERSRVLAARAAQGDKQAFGELAGLDPETWGRISTQQREQIKQQNATIGQLAYGADTPEKWAVAVQQARQMGLDVSGYEDFSQRNAILAQAGMLDDWIKSQEPKYIGVGENGVVNVRDPQALAAVARQTAGQQPQKAASKADYDALPPGASYIAPDGSYRVKGGAPSQGGATFP